MGREESRNNPGPLARADAEHDLILSLRRSRLFGRIKLNVLLAGRISKFVRFFAFFTRSTVTRSRCVVNSFRWSYDHNDARHESLLLRQKEAHVHRASSRFRKGLPFPPVRENIW